MSLPVKLLELPEIEGCILAPERHPPHRTELVLRRAIVDFLEMFVDCPHRECRCADACRSRTVACFDERRPVIVEFMPGFLYEGYLDEDGREL
jgi:hypothetical protein